MVCTLLVFHLMEELMQSDLYGYDAVADLGRPDEINRVVVGFQKYLYQESMLRHDDDQLVRII